MKKYNQIFVLIGILILIIAGISIVFFPEWSSGPAMLLKLVGLVVGAVLASVHYFFSIIKNYHDIRKNDISESPLTAVRPDELLARLGKGGEVKWIEREAAISSLLKRYGRLVITGKIKSGKTREAIEVIQQVVAEDLIRSDRIFEPAFALLLLTRKDLEVVILRKIDTKIPLLLFIDDLPFHYKNEDLKKLTELMNILQLHCKDLYVVATSRLDQINVNHDIWFYENEFFRVELTDLSSEQSGRIIDSAAEVYGLDIDVPVRQKLRSLSDGTPELPITSLRRFYALGTTLVKMEDMDQVVNTSIHDAWAMIRRQIQNQNPVAGLVIKALATFHHFNIVPYTDLVLDYTRYLNSQKKEKKLITIVSINNSIYSALEYIRKFDVVENNSIFSFPDVLVEESINQSGANKEFDNYLKLHSYGINKQLLIRIYTGLGRYYVDNHKKVLLYMNKLIALIPNYAMAYHMRAHAYHKLGEIEKAKVDYSQAIHLDLNNASYYYCRGELYRHIGDNERAFEDFNKAVQLDPNSSEAYHRRGHYHKDQKELQKALDDINIAIKLDPEEFHNYVLRGQIHYEQGNFDKALADVERVQKVKNVKYNKAWVYDLQGHMYMKLHRHKEALNSFNLAVDFNPASAMYLFCRSEFFYETGDLSLAFEDLNKAISLDSNLARAFHNRGHVLIDKGDMNKGFEDINESIRLDPNNKSYFYCRGSLYMDIDKKGEGIRDFSRAIELDPKDVFAYVNRFLLLIRAGKIDEANYDSRTVCSLKEGSAICHMCLGILYYAKDEYQNSLSELRAATSISYDVRYDLFLALPLLCLNRTNEAMQIIMKIVGEKHDIKKLNLVYPFYKDLVIRFAENIDIIHAYELLKAKIEG